MTENQGIKSKPLWQCESVNHLKLPWWMNEQTNDEANQYTNCYCWFEWEKKSNKTAKNIERIAACSCGTCTDCSNISTKWYAELICVPSTCAQNGILFTYFICFLIVTTSLIAWFSVFFSHRPIIIIAPMGHHIKWQTFQKVCNKNIVIISFTIRMAHDRVLDHRG